MSKQPIGIIDSGVGGISVLQSLRAQLPHEHFLYLADNLNLPYGAKSPQEVLGMATFACRRLVKADCKLIVAACNTITLSAISTIREQVQIPVIGVVPMVKPAAAKTRTGSIAVAATPATLASDSYHQLVTQYASGVEVINLPCPDWVAMVESGTVSEAGLREPLTSALRAGADMLVLGCTHFPFLIPQLLPLLPDGVRMLHSGPAIARQAKRVLESEGLLTEHGRGGITWEATDPSAGYVARCQQLAETPIDSDLRSVIVEY